MAIYSIENVYQNLITVKDHIITYSKALDQNISVLEKRQAADQDEEYMDYVQHIGKANELLREQTNTYLKNEVLQNKLHQPDLVEYLSKVRHDLRNPLNATQGYGELLFEHIKDTNQDVLKNAVINIIDISYRILELTNQITFSKLQPPHIQRSIYTLPVKGVGQKRAISNELALDEEYIKFKESISILIVDDLEENRELLTRYLPSIHYRNIHIAKDGYEAVNMIEKTNYDIVLLDIDMPGISGIEVMQRIKDLMVKRKMMVIVISASDADQNTINCIRLGAEDFLSKPVNINFLDVRLGACVEKKWFIQKETAYLRELEIEKRRYENLLQSIFPPIVVNELASKSGVETRSYSNVAVLFVDLVNFTNYCESHELSDIIYNIQVFSEICEKAAIKFNLQKIKTIGDGFLATAGMLTKNANPTLDCIACAQELIEEAGKLEPKWKIRVGIDFGLIIGGIVGHRQYLFDIWGDPVNTSARIQAAAEPNSIALTRRAWEQVENICEGESLGLIPLKGKVPTEIICFKKYKA